MVIRLWIYGALPPTGENKVIVLRKNKIILQWFISMSIVLITCRNPIASTPPDA